ncbi:MAG: SEC-C domain-containing protein [Firmicutes bacterium]|nr:SEC-C domain-containing protein [Bacillota bacterium]
MASKVTKLTDEQYLRKIIEEPENLTLEDYDEIVSRKELMAKKLLDMAKISGELNDFDTIWIRDEILLSLLSGFDKPYHFDHLAERLIKAENLMQHADYLIIAGRTHGAELFDKVMKMEEEGKFPAESAETVFLFVCAVYKHFPELRDKAAEYMMNVLKKQAEVIDIEELQQEDSFTDMIVTAHNIMLLKAPELTKRVEELAAKNEDFSKIFTAIKKEIEEDEESSFMAPSGREYFADILEDESLFEEDDDECCCCDDEECECDDEECTCENHGHSHEHEHDHDECDCGHHHGAMSEVLPPMEILAFTEDRIEKLSNDELLECLKEFHSFMTQKMVDKIHANADKLVEKFAELVLEEKSWQFRNEKENFAAIIAFMFMGSVKSPVVVDAIEKIRSFEFVYENLIGLLPDLVVSQGMDAVEKLKSVMTDTQKSDDYCSAILTGIMIYYLEKATAAEKTKIEKMLQEALAVHKGLDEPAYTSYEVCGSALVTGKKKLADNVRAIMEKWGKKFSFSERDYITLYEYRQMMPHFVIHDYSDLWETYLKDIGEFRRKASDGTLLFGSVKKLMTEEEEKKLFAGFSNETLARDIVLLNHQMSKAEISEIISRGKKMLPLLEKLAFDQEFENRDDYGKAYGAVLALRFIGVMGDESLLPLICEIITQKENNSLMCYDGSLILAQFGEKALPEVERMLVNRKLSQRLRAYLQDTLIRIGFKFAGVEEKVENVFAEYLRRITKQPDEPFVMIKALCLANLFGEKVLGAKVKILYKKYFGNDQLSKYQEKMMESGIYTRENMCSGPETLLSDEEILSLVYADEHNDFGYMKDEIDNSDEEQPVETFVREDPKVGRNDPCPCGSGKKYKKCCGQ